MEPEVSQLALETTFVLQLQELINAGSVYLLSSLSFEHLVPNT